jgi:hypothetical protein
VAYDASTGTGLWVRRYNGPGNNVDVATALGVSPDGSKVFVTGFSFGSGTNYDHATVAYSASSLVAIQTRQATCHVTTRPGRLVALPRPRITPRILLPYPSFSRQRPSTAGLTA